MGSMFAKLQQQKKDEPDKKLFMRDITTPDDRRYFLCTENGRIVASGEIEEVKELLGTSYSTRPIKFWRHDKITDTVKVVF